MGIYVYIDGEYFKRFESPQEMNEAKNELGKVAISNSEKRDDGGYNLYMVTIKE